MAYIGLGTTLSSNHWPCSRYQIPENDINADQTSFRASMTYRDARERCQRYFNHIAEEISRAEVEFTVRGEKINRVNKFKY